MLCELQTWKAHNFLFIEYHSWDPLVFWGFESNLQPEFCEIYAALVGGKPARVAWSKNFG